MEISDIQANYRYLIINSNNNEHHIVKTERNVSEILQNNYNISVSHMYIRRNLEDITGYILENGILIKKLW